MMKISKKVNLKAPSPLIDNRVIRLIFFLFLLFLLILFMILLLVFKFLSLGRERHNGPIIGTC